MDAEAKKREEERQKKAHEDVAKSIRDHRMTHEFWPPLVNGLRAQIDELDSALVALLRRRVVLVEAIGVVKRVSNKPIHDPARERQLLDRFGPTEEPARTCYARIIEECREHAKRKHDQQATLPPPPDDGGESDPLERA